MWRSSPPLTRYSIQKPAVSIFAYLTLSSVAYFLQDVNRYFDSGSVTLSVEIPKDIKRAYPSLPLRPERLRAKEPAHGAAHETLSS